MPTTLPKSLCFLLLLLASYIPLKSQCIVAPAAPVCNGTEPLVTDNETISLSTTKWFYGSATTYNSLTMNGGTLIVCGNLTIDKFYMDSGTIYVNPGARFVVGSGIGAGLVLRGNSAFYNYGTLEIQRNLSFDGGWASAAKPNILMNVRNGSVFNMPNQYFVINNKDSWFVNNGRANFWGIITDPNAPANGVCLGSGSTTYMNVFYNKARYSYNAPSGAACVSIVQYSQLYDTVTNSANINLCLRSSHYTDSSCIPWGCKPKAWGPVNTFKGCNSCSEIAVLPVHFVGFSITQKQYSNFLSWKTDTKLQNNYFNIERSDDGENFRSISSIAISDSTQNEFQAEDSKPVAGQSYYRIIYQTGTGFSVPGPVLKVTREKQANIVAYPNPFIDRIYVTSGKKNGPLRLMLYSAEGKLIKEMNKQASVTVGNMIDVPKNIPQGIYILHVVYDNEIKILKLKKE